MTIRPVREDDLPAVLAMNNAAVPAVNALEAAAMRHFAQTSPWFAVSRDDHGLEGFLIALDGTADYDSLNYRWFRARYAAFAYVDRIVIAERARRTGLGRRFYDAVEQWARAAGAPRLCAEVNLEPPNPGSIGFHRAAGFEQIGELAHPDDGKVVALFVKSLGRAV